MAVKRNVEGLRQNAQKKRQAALEKVEQGIRQLLREGKPINFNTVMQAADVSKAFLYKEPEIKERIEQLRQQGTKRKPELKERASDASKDAVIRTLRERIKKLEAEVRDLRRQNETAYGQVIEVNSLRQQVGRLQAENDRLRRQSPVNDVNLLPLVDISDFEAEIRSLRVELNTTILKLVQEAPSGAIKRAIESLREAIAENRVKNRAGFLVKAIQDAWKPNDSHEKKVERDQFNEWWDLAHASGLVVAAMQEQGVQYVMKPDQTWVTYREMLQNHSIASLKPYIDSLKSECLQEQSF